MTFDEFTMIADEEARKLPKYVYEGLSGGVLVDPNVLLHPKRLADDLYILGTYEMDRYGKRIVLYYGSFMAVMGWSHEDYVRERIRETLRHEFLHHMEYKAGLTGKGSLIEYDNDRMAEYYRQHHT